MTTTETIAAAPLIWFPHAVLFSNGLPFGSVLSYIYADLIVPPIMEAYLEYYGTKFAAILSGMIFISAVLTRFVIHFPFLDAGVIPLPRACRSRR